jgi:hypothetical protein
MSSSDRIGPPGPPGPQGPPGKFSGTVNTSIIPKEDGKMSLGSEEFKFSDIYVKNSLNIGDCSINADGDTLFLPKDTKIENTNILEKVEKLETELNELHTKIEQLYKLWDADVIHDMIS